MFLFQRNYILGKNSLLYTTWSTFKGKNKRYWKHPISVIVVFQI